MKNQSKHYKYNLLTFVGVTMALVASVRTVPTLAAAGWQQFVYVLFDLIVLAIPVSLISGEFGSMFPGAGGPQLWVEKALNDKWGFVVAWVLWVQMFPGMIVISSTLGPTIGEMINMPELSNNHWFILICILVMVWILTVLSLYFDVTKIGAQYGVWLGVYIPGLLMGILGLLSVIKVGFKYNPSLIRFKWNMLLPNITDVKDISYFTAVAFLFTGIILTSVYISELKNAGKNYIRGLLIALVLIVVINVFNSFFVFATIPQSKLELDNIVQPVALYCKILHLPKIIVNIFSFLVAIGIILQVSSWLNGPLRSMTQVAIRGLLPPKWKFHRTNKYGVSPYILIVQMIVLSLFGMLYAFTSNLNGLFIDLTDTTTLLYMLLYIILIVSLCKLRIKYPKINRPYRIGGKIKSNIPAYFVCGLLSIAIILSIISVFVSETVGNIILIVILTVILFIIPFIIDSHKKDIWLIKVQNDLNKRY